MIFHYLAWPFAAAKVHIIFHMTKKYIKKKARLSFFHHEFSKQNGYICKINFEFKCVKTPRLTKKLSYRQKNAEDERLL